MADPPDAAPRGLTIFVSYSRRDLDFAEQLVTALEAFGYAVVIDRTGIHGAERWEARLGQMILESDTIVFVLTPASAASEVCHWEVDRALERRKRIVPVLAKPLDAATRPHDALRDLNYIHFYAEPSFPGSGWGSGLARLHATLSVDVEWIREHTRVSEMAARWEAAAQADDLLARGSELARLQAWRDARPANAPELTVAQRRFMQVSEQAEAERSDTARRQIEEIRTAQQARAAALEAGARAQDERAKALRTLVRRTVVGGVVAGVLAVAVGATGLLAYRNAAETRRALAQIQDERLLQDRLIRLARNRDLPEPPYDEATLARRYEGQTADHVGTDFLGGVYYGVYRLQARTQMKAFVDFLGRHAPPWRERLLAAGGESAALARDAAFVEAWRALATDAATAAEFAALQHEFVRSTTYEVLVRRLAAKSGFDVRSRSTALKAVVYSIAVQHGPATRFVGEALAALGDPAQRSDRVVIEQLYRYRDRVDDYFPELRERSPNLVELIRERYQWEQRDALHMLEVESR